MDEAWSCYDQVQQLRPHLTERDRFLVRLTGRMDGEEQRPWSGPTVEHREAFLEGMRSLTDRISVPLEPVSSTEDPEQPSIHPDEIALRSLTERGDLQSAFFLARRLLASGESWAEDWLKNIQSQMK
jgi:hypothetical protein